MIFTIVNARYISIHVLREEGDRAGVGQVAMESQFLSTSSARRATVPQPAEMRGLKQFLSTSSARRATQRYGDRILWQYISIHVLREEGDTENSAHANQYG